MMEDLTGAAVQAYEAGLADGRALEREQALRSVRNQVVTQLHAALREKAPEHVRIERGRELALQVLKTLTRAMDGLQDSVDEWTDEWTDEEGTKRVEHHGTVDFAYLADMRRCVDALERYFFDGDDTRLVAARD